MSATGYVYYDGYGFKLNTNPIGQKGNKGDKGDPGDQGPIGNYADGYALKAVEKGFKDFTNTKFSNPTTKVIANTIVDISTDLSIADNLVDFDCCEDKIYFITDDISTTPLYVIDNFSGDILLNPTLSESVSWKEVKYARINGMEVICLASDNGFAYYDLLNSVYYSTVTNGVTTNCSKLFVSSTEVSFFTAGTIYRLTSDGSALSLSNSAVQSLSRISDSFHKAFGYYWNSDNITNIIYRTNETSLLVDSLDVSYSSSPTHIFSDSEYVYIIGLSQDLLKINVQDFSIKSSFDINALTSPDIFDPILCYSNGSTLFMSNPATNKIYLFDTIYETFEGIQLGVSADLMCRNSNINHLFGLYVSGGSDITEIKYESKTKVNNLYNFGGNYKKPKIITVTDSPYTVLTTDNVIVCQTSTGAITVNFPSDINFYGIEIVVVDVDGSASSNNITISGTNLNNGSPKTISSNFGRSVVYCYLTDSGPDSYWVAS